MKNFDWNFRRLDRRELEKVYQTYMVRDFPDSELKPLEMLEELEDRGINSVWGCWHGETLAGYYVLARQPGSRMILLDYLAVLPHLRDGGNGSAILHHLRRQLPEGEYLFIESESPASAEDEADRHIRERRIAFYRRNGAELSKLSVRLFGVDYAILTLGEGAPSGQELERAYRALYRQMLPEERFRRKVFTSLAQ